MLRTMWSIVVAMAVLCGCAIAEAFTLPQSLESVEDYAFAGNTSLSELEIPDGTVRIGKGAFENCEALGIVRIPDSVERIGEGAFANCAEDLLICTKRDSAAALYAVDNGIDYQADTVFRALLIGNTYNQDRNLRLFGPENDVNAMKACLVQFQGTPYAVHVRMDQKVDEMLCSIDDFFGSASPADVSLFYFSGHGVYLEGAEPQAALLSNDGADCLTVKALRAELDKLPGRKIVIIDACYSGGFIPDDSSGSAAFSAAINSQKTGLADVHSAQDYVDDLIGAFSVRARGLTANGYYVLTAASENEKSYETSQNGITMGVFTASFVKGCGWDVVVRMGRSLAADKNGNSVISVQEIYDYTRKEALVYEQHVKVSPENCGWFGMLRKRTLQ